MKNADFVEALRALTIAIQQQHIGPDCYVERNGDRLGYVHEKWTSTTLRVIADFAQGKDIKYELWPLIECRPVSLTSELRARFDAALDGMYSSPPCGAIPPKGDGCCADPTGHDGAHHAVDSDGTYRTWFS